MAFGMSAAKEQLPNYYGAPRGKTPLEKMYDIYGTSVEKQAGDYDTIMGNYDEIYKRATDPNQALKWNPMVAEQTKYSMSPDTRAALNTLKELSETGGLSATDQASLRARGVSPIRAMYASGQRDMERGRRLQGGYSPNYGAVTAKMTRDQSSMIADQMDKVNANIAQMVQSGKLSAAPNYASAAQAEANLMYGTFRENAANRQEANRINALGSLDAQKQNRTDALGAIHGKTNLYGTTPALANLYGAQARNDRDFEATQKQNKAVNTTNAIKSLYGGGYAG